MNIAKAAAYLSEKDKLLQPLIKSLGIIELPPPRSDLDSLLYSIVSQQLSVKAAATIHARVLLLLENDVRPEKILNLSAEELRSAGLSYSKASYMHALARAFVEDPDHYQNLHLQSNEEVIERLTAIKGIGRWTAEMFLMFTLLREDVFPIDDLGVRRGMEKLFYHGEKMDKKILTERAEVWKPYRSVVCFYLWKM